MKTSILILLFILLVLTPFGCSNDSPKSGGPQASDAKEVYTCPMHPSVISDRPGACPVCGMALVKKAEVKQATSDEMKLLRHVSLSPTQRVMANISTMKVDRQSLKKEISAVGVVDFAEPLQATVAARFRGRIEKLYANYTGEVVRKGQPLFELYSPDLITAQQDFLLALEALKNATSSINDVNVNVQKGLAQSSRMRLRVHFGLTEEQVSLIEKEKQMQHLAMYYSPISGTVLRKQVQEGQFIDEGALLYQLANLSRVWIYLDVYEKDVRFIKIGQQIHITTEAYPSEEFTGRVTFIDPVMSAETRTVRVRTEFANPSGKLKPNMFVKANIALPVDDAITIPSSALISTGKRNIVWVEVGENMFEPRDVVIGSRSESRTEVLSGLKEGESIVITGGYLVDSESQLQQPSAPQSHAGHGVQTTPQEKPAEDHSQHEKKNEESEFRGQESQGHEHKDSQGMKDRSEHKRQMSEDIQEMKVHVEHAYAPEVIKVKQGKKVRLIFHRSEDSKCTDEIVFKDFGIRKKLIAFGTTLIEFVPRKVGTFEFHCGMDMVYGKLIVEN